MRQKKNIYDIENYFMEFTQELNNSKNYEWIKFECKTLMVGKSSCSIPIKE